jgi:hypothetical protein
MGSSSSSQMMERERGFCQDPRKEHPKCEKRQLTRILSRLDFSESHGVCTSPKFSPMH